MKKVLVLLFLTLFLVQIVPSTHAAENIDYEDLFANHQSIMLIIHPITGEIYYANQAAADFYGYPLEILLEMNINQINTLTPEEVAVERLKALEEERNFFIFKHRLSNGDIRTVYVYSYPVDINGERYLYSIIIDQTAFVAAQNRNRILIISSITFLVLATIVTSYLAFKVTIKKREIEKTNYTLYESQKRFRILHNASFGGIAIHDQGVILECNQGLSEITGFSIEELMGMNGLLLIAPEDRDFVMNKIVTGYEKPYEVNGIRKNNEIYSLKLEARNLPYQGKQVRVVEFRDITEINTANTKLNQRNALIEGLFNHMTSGLAIYEVINDGLRGSDYVIKDFNDISLNWENKSRDEVVGKAISELHPNIDDSGIIEVFREVWKTGESVALPARQFVNGNYNRWHENRIFKLPSGEIVVMYDDVTERVLIENQRTKEHLDLLTSQKIAKLGTWRLDVKTNKISMSKELYKMHGFDPTKPVPPYSEHMKLFTKDSWDQLSTALALTSTKGIPYELELEMVSNNEPNGWMWVRGEAEYDDQGQIVSLTGAAQDITKQKLNEKEITNSYTIIDEQQRMQKTLISNLPGITYRCKKDADFTMVYISNQVAGVMGYTSQEFYDNKITFSQIIHPEDIDRVNKEFSDMSKSNETIHITYRIIDRNGHTKWVQENSKYIKENSGKDFEFFEGFIKDITEEKLLALEAEKNNQIITSILGQSPVAIEFFDSNGHHTYANGAALELFGVQNSIELEELNLFDNPNIPIELFERIKKAETIHVELEYDFTKVKDNNRYQTSKDGKILLDLSITPLTSNQVISGYIIHSKDITEERQKQNEIIYLSNHDYLTNLYNRRYFVNAFDKFVSRNDFPIGLMMIDINGLKIINDAYGHVRGDDAIRQVANLLLKVFDQDDVIARIGGDEFAILAPHKNDTQMQEYKDKLVLLSQDIKIDNIPVSLAIGYEILNDNDRAIDELLSRAEKRLYRHKVAVGESIRNHAIKAILNTLTDKYKEEKIHSAHVSQLCKQIGTELGLSKEDVDVLELAGMYHDIGKISIPDAILNKPGKLTDEEYDIIKTHTQIGYQILRAADEYSGLAEYALSHHERWDGRGYPKGLKGEEIPLFSRIINVADSFEAMTADRPYRKGMLIEDAIAEIKRCSGSQFDPEIAELFLEKVLNYE